MTPPDPQQVAEIAGRLSKASKRALVRIAEYGWTGEGSPGPARDDAYSLWWGRNGKEKLVLQPISYDHSFASCRWKWMLTPLGRQVRAHLIGKSHD